MSPLPVESDTNAKRCPSGEMAGDARFPAIWAVVSSSFGAPAPGVAWYILLWYAYTDLKHSREQYELSVTGAFTFRQNGHRSIARCFPQAAHGEEAAAASM